MSLELRTSNQQWSRFGIWLHAPGTVDTDSWSPTSNVVLPWLYNLVFPIGYMPVNEGLGYIDHTGSSRTTNRSWKPDTSEYDSGLDYRKYGSALDLFQFLEGVNSFDPGREHNTRHKSYRGRLNQSFAHGPPTYDYLANESYFRFPYDWSRPKPLSGWGPGWAAESSYLSQGYYPWKWINASGDFNGRVFDGVLTKERLQLIVDKMDGSLFNVSSYPYGDLKRSILIDDWSYSPGSGFTLSYLSRWTVWPGGYSYPDPYYNRAVWMRQTLSGVYESVGFTPIEPVPDSWNHSRENGHTMRLTTYNEIIYTYSGFESDWANTWYPLGQHWSSSKVYGGSDTILLQFPGEPDLTPASLTIEGFIRNHETARRRFYSLLDEYASDIRTSSLISTSKAVSSLNIGDNIQDILKLKDISVDAILDVVKYASGITNLRDISIKKVIDLMTSLRVSASFEFRPEVEFLSQDLPVLLTKWGDRNLSLGYGSFSYDFPYGAFDRDVKLTTHSRVVLLSPRSNFVATVLQLREHGLDPLPSRLWHIIPFSFVVDWVTGMGARIERAEDLLLNAGSPIINIVHSYTVETVLSEDEVESALPGTTINLLDSAGPLEMRGYFRDVSRYFPPFRRSRFDFGLPTGFPDGSLVASFVWQLLFS